MSKVTSDNLLEELRLLDDTTSRLKIKNVTIDKENRKVRVEIITDIAISDNLIPTLESVISKYMPSLFKDVKVYVTKVKADEDLVSAKAYEFITRKWKFLLGAIQEKDIKSNISNGDIIVKISLQKNEVELFKTNKILNILTDYLNNEFCGNVLIETLQKCENIPVISDLNDVIDINDFETDTARKIVVDNVRNYISYDNCNTAIYIADALELQGELYICGKITNIRPYVTSKEKTMFFIDVYDKTARVRCSYFPRKEKIRAVEALKEDDAVILHGQMEEYKGRKSFKIDNIGLCDFPQDFEPERKPGKKVPQEYKLVLPQELEDASQMSIFSVETEIPECLLGKTFVVFDIETTGLDYKIDKITEIGAVKIVDGKIVDGWTTLINPQVEISKKIMELTGITNEMVADKPVFSDVIGDFYKYIDGAYLVAHNASFDTTFIKHAGSEERFYIENPYYDTLEIATNTLKGLKNYKLDTVCGHFGIEFLHHRAMSDAHATAKMFIELIKLKKCLPF